MKYVRPHLSPELRAQITPYSRRDKKYTAAGVFFLLLSAVLFINLFPNSHSLSNNKTEKALTQSQSTQNQQETEVLGASTKEEATPGGKEGNSEEFTSYTVKNGDTLFNISQQYNIRWDLIAQINNLKEPYILHAGQTLKIPQATTSKVPNKIYVIKQGDTLNSIARAYNITVADIIAVNPNLQKSDLITVGQVIKLP